MGGLGFKAYRTLSLRLKLGIWGCGLRVQGFGFWFLLCEGWGSEMLRRAMGIRLSTCSEPLKCSLGSETLLSKHQHWEKCAWFGVQVTVCLQASLACIASVYLSPITGAGDMLELVLRNQFRWEALKLHQSR